jgi:hypothetical protein
MVVGSAADRIDLGTHERLTKVTMSERSTSG